EEEPPDWQRRGDEQADHAERARRDDQRHGRQAVDQPAARDQEGQAQQPLRPDDDADLGGVGAELGDVERPEEDVGGEAALQQQEGPEGQPVLPPEPELPARSLPHSPAFNAPTATRVTPLSAIPGMSGMSAMVRRARRLGWGPPLGAVRRSLARRGDREARAF